MVQLMCTVIVAVQTELSELSGHAAYQVAFQTSGPKLKSDLLIDTNKSSIKRLIFFMKAADGNFNDTVYYVNIF